MAVRTLLLRQPDQVQRLRRVYKWENTFVQEAVTALLRFGHSMAVGRVQVLSCYVFVAC